MKRTLISLITGVITLGIIGSAEAAIISFADFLQGVDNPTGWAAGDTVVQLPSSSYSLLGGMATVTGYDNNGYEYLSHRLTRGVGVWGAENDEVDTQTKDHPESIEITFPTLDYWVNSLEVRSLFYPDTGWWPNRELGAIDFYRDTTLLHTEYLFQPSKNKPLTTSGDLILTYSTPYLVDTLVFYVPSSVPTSYPDYDSLYNCQKAKIIAESEFALAKLDVEPIPEPTTMFLLGSGLLGLAGLGRARKKKRS